MVNDLIMQWPKNPPDVPLYLSKWFLWENRTGFTHLIKEGMTIIELGSWVGESTSYLAYLVYSKTGNSGKVYAVDTWNGSIEHQTPEYDNIRPLLYDTFLHNCWPYREIITPVRTDSLTGLQLLYDKGIKPDLVYIDASHEYKDVVLDIQKTYKLFPYSIMCGDDWLVAPNDVGKAATEFAKLHNFQIKSLGNFWLMEKNIL